MVTLFSSIVLLLAAGAAPAPTEAASAKAAPPGSTALCQAGSPAVAASGLGSAVFLDSFCQADCTEGPDVSCSGNVCSAQNQVCSAGQQGHVTCDGQTQLCNSCPPSGGGCTLMQCRQGCNCPGCFKTCVDIETCTCDCICN